jgi:hypothetical protein
MQPVSRGGEMKALVSCLSVLFFVSSNTPPVQAPQAADSCRFTVSGELVKPTISGPENITSLVHVVEQPDSPVEILAIDFKDSWLSIAHERETEQLRCTMKIRNRSDQRVKALSLAVIVASASGGPGTGFELSPGPGRSLAPGQEADISACGGGGSGGASGNHIRILVYVGRVDWDGCFYVPSKRLPYELGIFVHNWLEQKSVETTWRGCKKIVLPIKQELNAWLTR